MRNAGLKLSGVALFLIGVLVVPTIFFSSGCGNSKKPAGVLLSEAVHDLQSERPPQLSDEEVAELAKGTSYSPSQIRARAQSDFWVKRANLCLELLTKHKDSKNTGALLGTLGELYDEARKEVGVTYLAEKTGAARDKASETFDAAKEKGKEGINWLKEKFGGDGK